MSRAGSQQRTLLEILGKLRPHWRRDVALHHRIDSLLSGDRRLGSRDRRLYRELIYTCLRYLPWIEPLLDTDADEAVRRIAWLSSDAPAVQIFRRELTADMPECPAPVLEKAQYLDADPTLLSPSWLISECPKALDAPLRDALLSRAPLWLRLQTEEPGAVFSEFDELGWAWRRDDRARGAVKLPTGADASKSQAYLSGKVEIQDIGSQLILESLDIAPGGHWLDACAGAGGKTLQLAALLGPEGKVTARDVRRLALEQLGLRAKRAGLDSRLWIGAMSNPANGYSGVLVDAPCTGSGTWRRSPHLRWSTHPSAIKDASALQLSLLLSHARLVEKGGLLIYATCSLCQTENEAVAELFLSRAKEFSPEIPGRRIAPPEFDGDGFFVAAFRRAKTEL